MKKILSIEERQEVLIQVLKESDSNVAIFGVTPEVANPLIKKGILHKDTYKHTGGCRFTKSYRDTLTL